MCNFYGIALTSQYHLTPLSCRHQGTNTRWFPALSCTCIQTWSLLTGVLQQRNLDDIILQLSLKRRSAHCLLRHTFTYVGRERAAVKFCGHEMIHCRGHIQAELLRGTLTVKIYKTKGWDFSWRYITRRCCCLFYGSIASITAHDANSGK